MKTSRNRLLVALLSIAMLITTLPVTAFAEIEADENATQTEVTENNQAANENASEEAEEEEPALVETPAPLLTTGNGNVAEVTTSGGTTTQYTSLDDAINAWDDGSTLKLLADVQKNISVTSDKTVTLDLNGHVLQGTGSGSVITNKGTLTITDSNSDSKTHNFTVGSNGLWGLNSVETTADYTFDASEGLKKNGEASSDIPASGKTITVKGGCITGGTGSVTKETEYRGGGIVNSQQLTLEAGNIVGNTVTYQGGGIYNGKTFIMTGGSIVGNYSDSAGGGIYNNGTSTIAGGNVMYNAAKSNGGGIRMWKGYTAIIGGKISGNISKSGGGFRANQGELTIGGNAYVCENKDTKGNNSNSYLEDQLITISKDCVPESDMKVSVSTNKTPTVDDPVAITNANDADYSSYFISDNSKYFTYNNDDSNTVMLVAQKQDGKAIITNTGVQYLTVQAAIDAATSGQTVKMLADSKENISITSGKTVTLNLNGHVLKGEGNDHVITVQGALTLDDTSADKTGNVTGGNAQDGGGVYVSGNGFTLNGGTISDNKASINGGGLYVYSGSVTINGGTISGNTATKNGGGVYVNSGSVTMNGGTISGNIAGQGGGLYGTSSATAVSLLGGTITENKDTHGTYHFGGVLLSAQNGKTYTVGGDIKIYGNTSAGEIASNLNLWDFTQGSLLVDTEHPLAEGAYISISPYKDGELLTGAITNANSADYSGCFTSDNEIYSTYNDGMDSSQQVMLGNYVAVIEDTNIHYSSLQAAITAATEGQTVRLLTDRTENVTVPAGKNITLDLDGSTLTGEGINSTITVHGQLTVKKGTITHDNTGTPVNGGGVSVIKDTGDASFTLERGATITGCTAKCGGGVFVGEGTKLYLKGTIKNCSATEMGGGVFCYKGTVDYDAEEYMQVYPASINECSAKNYGGGIYNEYGTVTLNNIAISGCAAGVGEGYKDGYGGGVFNAGTLNIKFALIAACTAQKGAGVHNDGGKQGVVNMSSDVAYIMNNTAASSGGGVQNSAGATFNISGGTISGNNVINGYGGGVFTKGTMTLSGNASISDNTTGGKETDPEISNLAIASPITLGNYTGDEISAVLITKASEIYKVTSGKFTTNGTADYVAKFACEDENLVVKYNDGGWLEFAKQSITISANSATKIYDGKPLADANYTTSGDGLIEGDVLTAVVEGSITDVGVATNKITSYKIMRGDTDVTDYYDVKTESGVLQVTAPAKEDVRVDTEALTEVLKKYDNSEEYKGKKLAVELRIDEEVLADDKAYIENKLAELGLSNKKTAYIDAELWLMATDEDGTVEKNIGDENTTVVAATYKFDFTNKTDIRIFRLHTDSSEAKSFGELTSTPNELGEYVDVDKKAGTITVCASKYSTFVVTYSETEGAGGTNTGDSNNIALFLMLGILALAGAGLTGYKRREDSIK